jgi:hypothetical protein
MRHTVKILVFVRDRHIILCISLFLCIAFTVRPTHRHRRRQGTINSARALGLSNRMATVSLACACVRPRSISQRFPCQWLLHHVITIDDLLHVIIVAFRCRDHITTERQTILDSTNVCFPHRAELIERLFETLNITCTHAHAHTYMYK